MIPAPFEYLTPQNLDEAIRVLTSHGDDVRLMAGGHSLLPMMKLRLATPKWLIDLSRIPGLAGIKQEKDELVLGAMTTHYQIESSVLLRKKCPLLPQAAKAIGDVQVRNRGTIGGNLVHADPAADMPAAILALGGVLMLVGAKGKRSVPAEEFFLGLMTTAMSPDEILTEIRVPVMSGRGGTVYLKLPQKASGFAIMGVAVWLGVRSRKVCENVGIGITGLDSKPFRAKGVEDRLRGNPLKPDLIQDASYEVAKGVNPLDDIHASAEFRAHLAQLYTARALQEAAKRAGT